ncbi:MAG: hypothetical protein WA862_10980 [Solirubrobacterales bacterium]
MLRAGRAIADRLSINLNALRARAGISLNELSDRAAMDYRTISVIEGDAAHELRLTTALRLVHSLAASIDQPHRAHFLESKPSGPQYPALVEGAALHRSFAARSSG